MEVLVKKKLGSILIFLCSQKSPNSVAEKDVAEPLVCYLGGSIKLHVPSYVIFVVYALKLMHYKIKLYFPFSFFQRERAAAKGKVATYFVASSIIILWSLIKYRLDSSKISIHMIFSILSIWFFVCYKT